MKKIALITGTSSGIGKAAVEYFSHKGWFVFAGLRQSSNIWNNNPDVQSIILDVADTSSIKEAIKTVIQKAGKIDVVVNNAGFGAFGPFELSTNAQRKELFEVNVFGVMNVVQEVLPVLRKNHSGTIINVSSIGGFMTYPLFSVYHSSKWAIEGFSESLYLELLPLGIKLKIIEPGATKSSFNSSSLVSFPHAELTIYNDYVSRLSLKKDHSFEDALAPEQVAKIIFMAATDNTNKLRYVVGNRRSVTLAKLRKMLPTEWFLQMINRKINS